jgi:DHA1 family bicyclomycin/chloramphenicol resistance-like MFS transporter
MIRAKRRVFQPIPKKIRTDHEKHILPPVESPSNSAAQASAPVPASATGPLFTLSLASISLIGPLAVHLFMPVIPAVKAALGLSEALAQLTFSIALFSMAFATLVYGSLSDRYGRRPVLLSGLCLFLVGSAISAVADSIGVLVVGRLVQAVGAGCGITLVRAIAQDVYGSARRWSAAC